MIDGIRLNLAEQIDHQERIAHIGDGRPHLLAEMFETLT
jgi:hypothetical protein